MLISTKSYFDYPTNHRAWNHPGHCHFIHGYTRSFHFKFGSDDVLDACGFVMDFSGLKELKAHLDNMYDHTTLINESDPQKELFLDLHDKGILDLRIVENCTMEGTAKDLFEYADILVGSLTEGRVYCMEVEVRENQKNSAIYERP